MERVPLSEEEQRILHEMEKKLFEHDRSFLGHDKSPQSFASRSLRASVGLFIVGFIIVILSFASSLLLATFGFLVMLVSAVMFERGLRHSRGIADTALHHPLGDDLVTLAHRLRSRFFQQH